MNNISGCSSAAISVNTLFHLSPDQDGIMMGRQTRLAPGLCTICLSNFEIGSDVVWSSNPTCEHVFHEKCIEQWMMKQREGPLCPICRRDFIVDPFDIEDIDVDVIHDSSNVGDDEIIHNVTNSNNAL